MAVFSKCINCIYLCIFSYNGILKRSWIFKIWKRWFYQPFRSFR
jgi:hypothetical protein